MLKSVNIDYYLEGYRTMHSDCIELPLAGAAGFYNYDNYFFYHFYQAVMTNWIDPDSSDWINAKQKILEKIGLRIKISEVTNKKELISSIKENIDNQLPVVMIIRYEAFFFLNALNHHQDHGIIVSDYDEEHKIIVIREVQLNNEVTLTLARGEPFFKLRLTEELIADIWHNSNVIFKENKSLFYNKLLSIEKVSEPQIDNYCDLVQDFLSHYDLDNNNLQKILDVLPEMPLSEKDNLFFEILRRNFHGSAIILFDIFEKTFKSFKLDAGKMKALHDFKESFIKFRYLLISKLHADTLRGKNPAKSQVNELKEKVKKMDKDLYMLVNELFLLGSNRQEKVLFNYALKAKAYADSEFQVDDKTYCSASNAVNGKWDLQYWMDNAWHSDNLKPKHWLILDLFQPRTITKFVIRHSIVAGYITIDFKIQGSNDEKKWHNLVEVTNNEADMTIHNIAPSTYRYFRIYITCPCENDFIARIFEFEAWGVSQED